MSPPGVVEINHRIAMLTLIHIPVCGKEGRILSMNVTGFGSS